MNSLKSNVAVSEFLPSWLTLLQPPERQALLALSDRYLFGAHVGPTTAHAVCHPDAADIEYASWLPDPGALEVASWTPYIRRAVR